MSVCDFPEVCSAVQSELIRFMLVVVVVVACYMSAHLPCCDVSLYDDLAHTNTQFMNYLFIHSFGQSFGCAEIRRVCDVNRRDQWHHIVRF